MNKIIATWFYTGYLKPAPGTWGSAAAIPFAWVLHGIGGFTLLFAATVVVFFVGWWATAEMTRGEANHDPSEIVVDEVIGMWIALLPLSAGLTHAGVDPWVFPYPGWIGAFLAFRLFDIWKPGPVGYFDRKSTPFGVIFDDVVAGVLAAICVSVAAYVSHGILGQ
ncbi:MAG: phosphatidylglycerophosphatase A [Pseudoruegeria sp.]